MIGHCFDNLREDEFEGVFPEFGVDHTPAFQHLDDRLWWRWRSLLDGLLSPLGDDWLGVDLDWWYGLREDRLGQT